MQKENNKRFRNKFQQGCNAKRTQQKRESSTNGRIVYFE